MADQITSLSDVIKPEIVVPAILEVLTRDDAPWNSGIFYNDPTVQAYVGEGGSDLISFPFTKKFTGDPTLLNEGQQTIETDKTSQAKQVAPKEILGVGFQQDMVAVNKSKVDFNQVLINDLPGYWAETLQQRAITRAEKVFGSTNGAAYVKDISGETASEDQKIDSEAILDTTELLGVGRKDIEFMVIHPKVSTALNKQDDLTFYRDSEGKKYLETYKGITVIESEAVGTSGSGADTIYNTHFYKRGAFAYGVARAFGITPLETKSNPQTSTQEVYSKLASVVHLGGTQFTATSVTATNLADSTKWDVVVSRARDFPAVMLKSKI